MGNSVSVPNIMGSAAQRSKNPNRRLSSSESLELDRLRKLTFLQKDKMYDVEQSKNRYQYAFLGVIGIVSIIGGMVSYRITNNLPGSSSVSSSDRLSKLINLVRRGGSHLQPADNTQQIVKSREEMKVLADKFSQEIENMKMRHNRETDQAKNYAVTKIAEDVIEVQDDLERCLLYSSSNINNNNESSHKKKVGDNNDEKNIEVLREGVEMTLSRLQSVLNKHDIVEIETKNAKFDPNFHESKSQIPVLPEGNRGETIVGETVVESEGDVSNTAGYIAKELRKGFKINGRVLRAAEVVVFK